MALLAAALAGAPGCARLMGYTDGGTSEPIKQYPDGPEGLKALFDDVLDNAKKDERGRVHDLLASTIASDADLQALFGAQSAVLIPKYHRLMETLVNRGAVELVAQVYERKLDTVEVFAVDLSDKAATAEDRAIAKALTAPLKIYSVRIRKAADARGLRYDFFFYRNGKWLTGNQLGKYVEGYRPPDGGAK